MKSLEKNEIVFIELIKLRALLEKNKKDIINYMKGMTDNEKREFFLKYGEKGKRMIDQTYFCTKCGEVFNEKVSIKYITPNCPHCKTNIEVDRIDEGEHNGDRCDS